MKRNKIAIISDSIIKPIDMRRFNKLIVNGDAVKRAYGCATAPRLNHISHDLLIEGKPNIVIICAGTNNFTKKNHSTEETTGEIIDIVNTCRRKGAEKVFVSSITCRPKYQSEVKKVNDLL